MENNNMGKYKGNFRNILLYFLEKFIYLQLKLKK